MTSIKWTNKQLVEALQSVPDEPAKATLWWKSTAGIALLTQITDHVAMPVVRGVQRELSVEVDPAEVASTAWLMLSPDRPVLLRHLTQDATGNAWAYLFTSIKNQILDDVGRYYRRELLDDSLLHAHRRGLPTGKHSRLRGRRNCRRAHRLRPHQCSATAFCRQSTGWPTLPRRAG